MNNPAIFRWLSRKYPTTIVDCVDQLYEIDMEHIPYISEKISEKFDNLYVDVNSILDSCLYSEHITAPNNKDAIIVSILDKIDRLFYLVKPKKVLYIAMDGVAPRAIMNQQRSRRFKASKETHTEKGCFNSNCIAPGTPFMSILSNSIQYYIHDRLNNHLAWKHVKVILSDSNTAGQAKHKIMEYIRQQRAQLYYNRNTHHALFGADSDLITLGLATHELYLTIIRQEFNPNELQACDICNRSHHQTTYQNDAAVKAIQGKDINKYQHIFINLNVLRKCLERQLYMPDLPFKYDFERAIDDWVFLCIIAGNEILPHLPTFKIEDNTIDKLVEIYKRIIYKAGGFLTDSGEVDLDRVQFIFSELATLEDEILKEQDEKESISKSYEENKNKRFETIKNYKPVWHRVDQLSSNLVPERQKNSEKIYRKDTHHRPPVLEIKNETKIEDLNRRDRYYEHKFSVQSDDLAFRDILALQYVRGLCWVLRYYYQGCPSWKWYFPYHYAPFASDFINITGLSTEFESNTYPLRPLEQLMAVFPAASSEYIPAIWAKLMIVPTSELIEFYPQDFKVDLNGMNFTCQGVALLPFIDEERLLRTLEPYYRFLKEEEKKRNVRGDDKLYVGPCDIDYYFLENLYRNKISYKNGSDVCLSGIEGTILVAEDCVKKGATLLSPINKQLLTNNKVISVRFKNPTKPLSICPVKEIERAVQPFPVLKTEVLHDVKSHISPQSVSSDSVFTGNNRYVQEAGIRRVNVHRNITNSRQPAFRGRTPSSFKMSRGRNHHNFRHNPYKHLEHSTYKPCIIGNYTNNHRNYKKYNS